MTPNYKISGTLPFNTSGNLLTGAQSGLAGLAEQYGKSYKTALEQNQAMYSDIMGGYQQTIQNQTSAQDALAGGYTQLHDSVLGQIQGIDTSQRQQIADDYTAAKGRSLQSAVTRGLGNTTVSDSMQRGLDFDKAKADIALSNQTSGLLASYQSQLGQAGLRSREQSYAANTGQANQQLGFMNSVMAAYPKGSEYANLYAQQGQWDQANADRKAVQAVAARGGVTVPTASAGGGGSRGSSGFAASSSPFGRASADPSVVSFYGQSGVGGGGRTQILSNPEDYDIGRQLEAMGLGPAGDNTDAASSQASWDEYNAQQDKLAWQQEQERAAYEQQRAMEEAYGLQAQQEAASMYGDYGGYGYDGWF